LAKAKEAAKAPAGEIVEAYKQYVSQLQFRRNYVPALLWLYDNISAREFTDTVKKSVGNGITDNLHRIAIDFDSSKNWGAFKLYLDAVFSEISDGTAFAAAMAAGLDENSSWPDDFLKYARNNPKLTQYVIETYEKRAAEKIMQEEFIEAAVIYRDIANQCASGHNKGIYELKAYECIFENGQYDKILPELDDFINRNKSVDRDSAAKAMLIKGRIYIQLDKINEACEIFSTVIEEYPETQCKPEAGFFIGYCYILQEKYKKAMVAMEMVTENYPQNPFASKAYLCLAGIDGKTE
jgi:tetratricopeptide (TPR) repeat protein